MPTIRTSFRGTARSGKAFARIQERLAKPLASPVGREVAEIMRQGPGSVMEQRRQQATAQATVGGDLRTSWPATKAWPLRPAPSRSLYRTGASDAQWMGGPGSITQVKPDRVAIGVTGYPAIHQRDRPTIIRAKRRGASGRLVMQVTLGKLLGHWFRESTLLRGLVVPPRRVGISRTMLRRAAEVTVKGLVRRAA